MILIAPEKEITKKKIIEKIATKVDTKFYDGTEKGNQAKSNKFGDVSTMDELNPPKKATISSSILDGSEIQASKTMEKHFDDKSVRKCIIEIGKHQCENPKKAFIVILQNKVYKKYSKMYKRIFNDILGVKGIVITLDDYFDDKTIIKKDIRKILNKSDLKKLEKKCGAKSKKKVDINKLDLPW